MKAKGATVPPNAVPLDSCVRDWDGATVEFFVLKSWRRSHDRQVDGTVTWRPVAAIQRFVLWTGGSYADEADARTEAAEKCQSMRRPDLFGDA